jgi:hypothetical protein
MQSGLPLPIKPIGDRLVLRSAEGIWLRIDAIISIDPNYHRRLVLDL